MELEHHHGVSRVHPIQGKPLTSTSAEANCNSNKNKINIKEIVKNVSLFFLVLVFVFLTALTIKALVDDATSFHGLTFTVISVTVSPFNISSSHDITAKWSISFSIENPHGYLYFEDMETSILFKNENISSTKMGNFSQGYDTEMWSLVNLVSYADQRLSDAIIDERAKNGVVPFTVKLNSGVNFSDQWKKQMTLCVDIWVKFLPNGQGVLLGIPDKAVYKG